MNWERVDPDKVADAAVALLLLSRTKQGGLGSVPDTKTMRLLRERGWIDEQGLTPELSPKGTRRAKLVLRRDFAATKAAPREPAELPELTAVSADRVVVVRCTGKLLSALKVKPEPVPAWVSPDRDWHANLMVARRRKSVLVCHSKTLYAVVLPFVRQSEWGRFSDLFWKAARETLERDFCSSVDPVIPTTSPRVIFAKTNSRSVLGSMGDLAYHFEMELHESSAEGPKPDFGRLTTRLSRIPMCGTLDGAFAVDEMEKLLPGSLREGRRFAER